MISDEQIASALHETDRSRPSYVERDAFDFRITDIRVLLGAVDLALEQRAGQHARIVVPLPSSGSPQYWLYAAPDNATGWVDQLLIWIDEEVGADGMGETRARDINGGESYVVAENYGWRRQDASEHERLLAAAGPDGWSGPVH
ncbi:hypothetical protein E6C70_09290 [Glaciibacter flavus]|uniref:Uncharacterized protein n=1 Tax=Orlajensenia flava TaxID=2565934 RepID=A0A4S4FVT6_9MICO|nr:hypothetical protein [Glaciibacter flavus]THG34448.1 hypothetical protein E6C70_09290 [Glaciibacter flavus]